MSDSHMVMVFEYCSGGDLSKYINRNGKLPESKAQQFMKQLGEQSESSVQYEQSLHNSFIYIFTHNKQHRRYGSSGERGQIDDVIMIS